MTARAVVERMMVGCETASDNPWWCRVHESRIRFRANPPTGGANDCDDFRDALDLAEEAQAKVLAERDAARAQSAAAQAEARVAESEVRTLAADLAAARAEVAALRDEIAALQVLAQDVNEAFASGRRETLDYLRAKVEGLRLIPIWGTSRNAYDHHTLDAVLALLDEQN
jgi:hypothetical protein